MSKKDRSTNEGEIQEISSPKFTFKEIKEKKHYLKKTINFFFLLVALVLFVFFTYVVFISIKHHIGEYYTPQISSLTDFIIKLDKSGLTYIIFFIFSLGLLSISFKYNKALNEECWTNLTSESIKQHIPLVTFQNYSTYYYNISSDKVISQIKIELGRLKGVYADHIRNLFQIYSIQGTNVSQDSLITNLENKLLVHNRPRSIYYMTTLAFVGTLYGIIVVFHNFSSGLSKINDPDKFYSRFKDILFNSMSGLDTAFYTTLVATFFGGVILYLLQSRIVRKNYAIIDHIENETATMILPLMNRANGNIMDNRALELLDNFNQALEKHRESLNKIPSALEQHLNAIKNSSDILKAGESKITNIQDTVKNIANHIGVKEKNDR